MRFLGNEHTVCGIRTQSGRSKFRRPALCISWHASFRAGARANIHGHSGRRQHARSVGAHERHQVGPGDEKVWDSGSERG